MRQAVRDSFVAFSSPLEGVVAHMYTDILGLVTVAIGVLIDPMPHALLLPFVKQDGTPATQEEIADEWKTIKSHKELAAFGHRSAAQYCRLRLTPEGVEQVVLEKLDKFEGELRKRFSEWDEWPADAQLATLSLSWAVGPWFRFGNLEAACKAQDWIAASKSCEINSKGNAGIKPRNRLNCKLYENAAWIAEHNLDRDTLLWTPDVGPA